MRRVSIRVVALACLLAAPLFAQGTPAPRDSVRKTDGKSVSGVVLNETPAAVEIDTKGAGKADVTLDQKDVQSIAYGGAPVSYTQAMSLLKVRQFDKAISGFNEAMELPGARKWVKDYAAYYIGVCWQRKSESTPADRAHAVDAFLELLKNPDNRWRDEAHTRLAELYLASGDRAKAQAEFEQVEKEAVRDDAKLNAQAGLAAILVGDNKPADALTRYESILAGAKDRFPDLYSASLVGKAEALIALKQFADAETFLNGALKGATTDELRAKARLALGDCSFAQAQAANDETQARNLFKAALNNYLWDVVVFFDQKNECAKSLLFAGKCWEKLAEPARAQELYRKLRNEYAGTRWAAMVAEPEAPKPDAPKPDAPKPDAPAEPPKPETPKPVAQALEPAPKSLPSVQEVLMLGSNAPAKTPTSAAPDALTAPTVVVKVDRIGESEGVNVGGDLGDALGDMGDWRGWKERALAVWLFDESLSMKPHQQLIRQKVDELYVNLGIAQGSGEGRRVMTAVCSYGKNFHVVLKEPTGDLKKIRQAIDSVPVDDCGIENYIGGINGALAEYGPYAKKAGRNIILIIATDEAGDDDAATKTADPLEATIQRMQKSKASLMVFSCEAGAFNYASELAYDPTVKAGVDPYAWVNRGLDTAFGEMLPYDDYFRRVERVPSGFGPYGYTRMCRETGGMLYLLRDRTDRTYDYDRMLKGYQPEVDSRAELLARTGRNQARRVIMGAIEGWNAIRAKEEGKWNVYYSNNEAGRKTMESSMRVTSEWLQLVNDAIKKLNMLFNVPFTDTPSYKRWDANRELMWAQLHKARFQLAQYQLALDDLLKQHNIPPPADIGWVIGLWRHPILRGDADKVNEEKKMIQGLYQRVIDHHPGTPWAVFARGEMGSMTGYAIMPWCTSGPSANVKTERR